MKLLLHLAIAVGLALAAPACAPQRSTIPDGPSTLAASRSWDLDLSSCRADDRRGVGRLIFCPRFMLLVSGTSADPAAGSLEHLQRWRKRRLPRLEQEAGEPTSIRLAKDARPLVVLSGEQPLSLTMVPAGRGRARVLGCSPTAGADCAKLLTQLAAGQEAERARLVSLLPAGTPYSVTLEPTQGCYLTKPSRIECADVRLDVVEAIDTTLAKARRGLFDQIRGAAAQGQPPYDNKERPCRLDGTEAVCLDATANGGKLRIIAAVMERTPFVVAAICRFGGADLPPACRALITLDTANQGIGEE